MTQAAPQGETARLVSAWAPPALYMAAIWVVSSMSRPGVDLGAVRNLDKLVHGTEFAVLGCLLARAVVRTFRRHPVVRAASVGGVMTVAWGALDELHQAFVPMRSADVWDLAADAAGACLGVAAYVLLRRARSSSGEERNAASV